MKTESVIPGLIVSSVIIINNTIVVELNIFNNGKITLLERDFAFEDIAVIALLLFLEIWTL
jgi:hypothetical protein